MDGQESSDKQEKMSTKVRVVQTGGVNVGGLLVVVGALAVSGLVKVVASRIKNRRDANNNGHGRGEEDETRSKEGLPSVLETPPRTTHQNQCCKSYELQNTVLDQMDSIEMPFGSLILEESPVPGVLDQENGDPARGDQEVLIEGSAPATIVVAQAQDHTDEPEEIRLPAPDSCFDSGVLDRENGNSARGDQEVLIEGSAPGVLDRENGNSARGDQEVLIEGSAPNTIVLVQAQDHTDEPEEIRLPAPDSCFDSGEETSLVDVFDAGNAEQSTVDMEARSEEETTVQPITEKQASQGSCNCEDQEITEEDHIIGKNEAVNAPGESGTGNTLPSDLLPAPEATSEGLQEKMEEEEEEEEEKVDRFKGSSSSCCNTINNFVDGATRDLKDSRFFQKGKAIELLVMSDQIEHKLKTGIWGLSLLGIMSMLCYYWPMTTACLAALFITVLSFKA